MHAIIIPYKENFSNNNSGAASIFVKESLHNIDLKKIIIYGSYCRIDTKYKKIFFFSKHKYNYLRNYFYIKEFVNKFKNTSFKTIEVHNRPEYVKILKKFFPKTRIIFYFHNNPNLLRGSKTFIEKKYLIKNCEIFFLSAWIKKKFNENFLKQSHGTIIYPGIKRNKVNYSKKKNIIIYVGKLNHSKGYNIFCEATKKLKENKLFASWRIISCGTENRRIIKKYSHIKELGQISNDKINKLYNMSKISVAPSTWEEPLGRSPIESAANCCLSISSNKAGLAESNKNGIKIKNINEDKLYSKLFFLCLNQKYLKKKSILSYKKFFFNKKKFLTKINNIRNQDNNIKKVLLIANLNFKNKKRLFYSFFNKLSLGLKDTFLNVKFMSDRDYLRKKRSLFDPLGIKGFNSKIVDIVKKNNFDLIILGHTDKISINTYKEIISTNNKIKIIKIYIDSISDEFFNFDKVFYDYYYLDKIFITSNPKKLSNYDIHRKINFLPYPVHPRIDYLKSFLIKKKEIDVFFALSHGQNRGVLKKGKIDERESLLNYVKKKLNKKINLLFVGTNNIQPVWGKKFYKLLSKSKITINLSRGKYKDLYSSDRISTLIGNGSFVLNEKINNYSQLFKKNELINFKNKYDLVNKINYYLENNEKLKAIAKRAYYKYHKKINIKILINYILDILNDKKNKYKYFWSNL